MWKLAPRNEDRLAHLQAIAIHRLYKSSLNLSRGQIESCWSNITRKAINFFEQLNSSSSRQTSGDHGSRKGSSVRAATMLALNSTLFSWSMKNRAFGCGCGSFSQYYNFCNKMAPWRRIWPDSGCWKNENLKVGINGRRRCGSPCLKPTSLSWRRERGLTKIQ